MKVLAIIGRVIYSIPFIIFGIFHFMNNSQLASYVLKGWPYAEILVYVAGAALIIGGLAILFGILGRLASFLMAALLLVFILTVHLPGVQAGDQMSMTGLLKDIALMGAAISYAATAKK
jgi:uncharacterized membrane protein YphA (DoxX/SURF4 family)